MKSGQGTFPGTESLHCIYPSVLLKFLTIGTFLFCIAAIIHVLGGLFIRFVRAWNRRFSLKTSVLAIVSD